MKHSAAVKVQATVSWQRPDGDWESVSAEVPAKFWRSHIMRRIPFAAPRMSGTALRFERG